MSNLFFFLVIFNIQTVPSLALLSPVMGADLSEQDKAWLDLVDPILTSEERRIFKKRLKNSRKRAEFIDLFWAKRDEDLTDTENPFRESYLARYDFVMANFDRGNKRPSSAKGQLFLLLGKPDRIETRVDFRLAGLDYKNPFVQFQPELWIYHSVGYEFPRDELRIQFVPVSEFGEFTALTDQLSWHFIRNLKYKFILHRDLKKAPLQSSGGENFQYSAGGESSESDFPSPDNSSMVLPKTGITRAPSPPTQATPSDLPKEKPKPEPPVPLENAEDAAPSTPPSGASQPPSKPLAATETRQPEKPKPKPEKPAPAILEPADQPKKAEKLVVPETKPRAEKGTELLFQTQASNPNQLTSELAYFSQDPNQSLLIGRLGVPMIGLDFQFNGKAYEASFALSYRLTDAYGRVYLQEKIPNRMSVPQQTLTMSDVVYFSKEFTLLVPSGRYALETQIEISSKNQISYSKNSIEVLPFTNTVPSATPLFLLDPHISENQTQIQVTGKPYGLNLVSKIQEGDPIYPLIELTGPISDSALNTIEFAVIREGVEIARWGLYPEELTNTAQGTLWIHPVLSTKSLDFGPYTLRFEMQLGNGQWLSRDKTFFMK